MTGQQQQKSTATATATATTTVAAKPKKNKDALNFFFHREKDLMVLDFFSLFVSLCIF